MPSVSTLVHISRSAPWYRPAINFPYGPLVRWILTHIPFARKLLRLLLVVGTEMAFKDTNMEEGRKGREKRKMQAVEHIKKTAPEKYWKTLMPDFEFGCKVR